MSYEKPAYHKFTSPLNTVHVITHNLNTIEVLASTIDQATNEEVFGSVIPINANQVQITFFTPVAIRGVVV